MALATTSIAFKCPIYSCSSCQALDIYSKIMNKISYLKTEVAVAYNELAKQYFEENTELNIIID